MVPFSEQIHFLPRRLLARISHQGSLGRSTECNVDRVEISAP